MDPIPRLKHYVPYFSVKCYEGLCQQKLIKALRIQEILQHLLAVLGEDGLGVELDSVDG
jgi:hypothetical protein